MSPLWVQLFLTISIMSYTCREFPTFVFIPQVDLHLYPRRLLVLFLPRNVLFARLSLCFTPIVTSNICMVGFHFQQVVSSIFAWLVSYFAKGEYFFAGFNFYKCQELIYLLARIIFYVVSISALIAVSLFPHFRCFWFFFIVPCLVFSECTHFLL